eukprot:5894319-Pyramimonas_sp.AAC.1
MEEGRWRVRVVRRTGGRDQPCHAIMFAPRTEAVFVQWRGSPLPAPLQSITSLHILCVVADV